MNLQETREIFPRRPKRTSTIHPEGARNMAIQSVEGADESSVYKTDEFRMYCFKVLPCSKRFCHDWTKCPFAHPGEKARRRDPRVYKYFGTPCPEAKAERDCPRGSGCPYAHSIFEYWLHPSRYRTQPCNDGTTCRRNVCFFAHTLEELRVPFKGNCSPKAGGSKSTNMFVAKMPPSMEEIACNKENGAANTLGEGFAGQAVSYTTQIMDGQLHVAHRSFSMDNTNHPIANSARQGRQETYLRSWDDEIPSWSMCGAADGRPFFQGIFLDENIENLARMTYEMGIKESVPTNGFEHPPHHVPLQLRTNGFRGFPQAVAAGSIFPPNCNSKIWAQYPVDMVFKNRSLGGFADHENTPEVFSPVEYQVGTDPVAFSQWQPSSSQNGGSTVPRTQLFNPEELSIGNPLAPCHIPCYTLSHEILGESAWSRQADNHKQK